MQISESKIVIDEILMKDKGSDVVQITIRHQEYKLYIKRSRLGDILLSAFSQKNSLRQIKKRV